MGCPRLCWALDNRDNCLVVQDPPEAQKPRSAVGDAPHIVLHCEKCGRTWWRWSVRDRFSRLSQRWYIVKKESNGVPEYQNLDG